VGGGGLKGGTSCTPSKDFEKLDHKNGIKHKKRTPSQIFSQPQVPPSKEFENDSASMITISSISSKIQLAQVWIFKFFHDVILDSQVFAGK
jgi:hypothetical protein